MYRGNVIKLYPNRQQAIVIKMFTDATRYIYNHCLAMRIEHYKQESKTISKNDLFAHIKYLKDNDAKHSWLKSIHSQVLQQSIHRLDRAYTNFFRRVKQGTMAPGFPKFKSKKYYKHSCDFPQGVKMNDSKSKIYLPKIGWVKCRGASRIDNKSIKTVTVTLQSDGYITASVIAERENQTEANTNYDTIGIDVGTRSLIADSHGTQISPIYIKPLTDRIAKYQNMLERSKKGSNNRTRIKNHIAKLYRKITNIRDNYLHHVANQYTGYRIVYVEDLKIQHMTMNTKGTKDKPNYHSKQKTKLNAVIIRQAWGKLFDILSYKLSDRKSMLVKVDPSYTSQTCSKCSHIDKKSRHGKRYTCTACGYSIDADTNAAINIETRGRTEYISIGPK